jgi:hypothetical protein
LQQLKEAGLEQWDSLKDQAGKAWEGLEKALQDLAAGWRRDSLQLGRACLSLQALRVSDLCRL